MPSKRYNKLPKGTKSITSDSIDKLIEDNELTEVFDSFEIQSKNKKYKHYCVYGTNI